MLANGLKKVGAAEIAALIRREILSENLTYRDKLPAERILADYYNVSRGTIRSAIKTLESENLVSIKPGSGVFIKFEKSKVIVSQVENSNPLELIDARFAIEPHVCRLAILHGKRDHFSKLEELTNKMKVSTHDPQEFAEADTKFHKTLAESTGNNLLIWIINQITAARGLREWTKARNLTLNKEIMTLYNAQHHEIIKFIRAREPELAASAMKDHLETARLSLTRASGT